MTATRLWTFLPAILASACAVNPVPTPASSGGFTFSPGQPTGSSDASTASDTAAADLTMGVQNPEAGDAAETAARADVPGDVAGVPDTAPGDTTSAPDTSDAKADTADAKIDTGTDAKTDTKTDALKPDVPPPPPKFGDIWNGVILKYGCGSNKCHGPAGQPYLFPDAANAYGKLLGGTGGASYACAGKVYVVPGDPKASLLWQKVAPGVEACGDKMPVVLDGGGIEPEDAALVADWIATGAAP